MLIKNDNEFVRKLKQKMDSYAHLVYKISRKFPKEELYGITSQSRRAALSVILNYIEGFARQKKAVKKNFWEISYGSLKEVQYILYFSLKEKFINKKDYEEVYKLGDEIAAMLWKSIKSLE